MEQDAHYTDDLLLYFQGHGEELELYEALFQRMNEAFPEARVRVQKSQISFYNCHLFAAVSLPVRRKKGWPERCLLVTFGLGAQVAHPRIAVSVEPYPNRWTHHVLVSRREDIDEVLLGWLTDAFAFSLMK